MAGFERSFFSFSNLWTQIWPVLRGHSSLFPTCGHEFVWSERSFSSFSNLWTRICSVWRVPPPLFSTCARPNGFSDPRGLSNAERAGLFAEKDFFRQRTDIAIREMQEYIVHMEQQLSCQKIHKKSNLPVSLKKGAVYHKGAVYLSGNRQNWPALYSCQTGVPAGRIFVFCIYCIPVFNMLHTYFPENPAYYHGKQKGRKRRKP